MIAPDNPHVTAAREAFAWDDEPAELDPHLSWHQFAGAGDLGLVHLLLGAVLACFAVAVFAALSPVQSLRDRIRSARK